MRCQKLWSIRFSLSAWADCVTGASGSVCFLVTHSSSSVLFAPDFSSASSLFPSSSSSSVWSTRTCWCSSWPLFRLPPAFLPFWALGVLRLLLGVDDVLVSDLCDAEEDRSLFLSCSLANSWSWSLALAHLWRGTSTTEVRSCRRRNVKKTGK